MPPAMFFLKTDLAIDGVFCGSTWSKNRQVGLHHTKKLHSGGHNQYCEKATYEMRENICKPVIW